MDLSVLTSLADWMRAHGATHARVGDIELTLTPHAPVAAAIPAGPVEIHVPTKAELDAMEAEERAAYEEILFASS